MDPERPEPGKAELALLLLANVVGGSSAIMIKASTIHPALQASYRLLGAGLLLLPLFLRDLRRSGKSFSPRLLLPSILPAIALGLHFISWILGARLTLAGNATVIVTMVPVAMPLLAFLATRELPRRTEVLGTVVAMSGAALLAAFDFRLEPAHFGGDLVCFASMILYTVYLVLARRNAPREGIWLYLVPLYLMGGVFCFLCALPFADPVRGITRMDLLMTLGLVLGPTMVGHSLMNRAMTRLPAQTVSLFNLTQFMAAGILAYFIFGEVPRPLFAAASAAIAAGIAIPVLARRR